MKPKFKKGDVIGTVETGKGFEEAIVINTFTSQEKRTKGKQMYLLKIMNGIATIPVSAEVNYELKKKR